MRSNTKAFFWIVALFLSGTLFGSVLTYYVVPRADNVRGEHKGGGPKPPAEVAKMLKEKLQLRDDQVPRIQEIIQQGRERYRTIGQDSDQKFQQARAETREKIRALLDAGQKQRYEQWVQELDRRWKERHQNREHPRK